MKSVVIRYREVKYRERYEILYHSVGSNAMAAGLLLLHLRRKVGVEGKPVADPKVCGCKDGKCFHVRYSIKTGSKSPVFYCSEHQVVCNMYHQKYHLSDLYGIEDVDFIDDDAAASRFGSSESKSSSSGSESSESSSSSTITSSKPSTTNKTSGSLSDDEIDIVVATLSRFFAPDLVSRVESQLRLSAASSPKPSTPKTSESKPASDDDENFAQESSTPADDDNFASDAVTSSSSSDKPKRVFIKAYRVNPMRASKQVFSQAIKTIKNHQGFDAKVVKSTDSEGNIRYYLIIKADRKLDPIKPTIDSLFQGDRLLKGGFLARKKESVEKWWSLPALSL